MVAMTLRAASAPADAPADAPAPVPLHATREGWLEAAIVALSPLFDTAGLRLPMSGVRVGLGFPSRHGLPGKHVRIGECWAPEASTDGRYQIFISPLIADSGEALAVLAHELVHAAVGTKHGHRGPFAKAAVAVGLVGPMRTTKAGPGLVARLVEVAGALGAYPHAKLDPRKSGRPVQGTRMLKASCDECGYTVRLTARWAALGTPRCPMGHRHGELALEAKGSARVRDLHEAQDALPRDLSGE